MHFVVAGAVAPASIHLSSIDLHTAVGRHKRESQPLDWTRSRDCRLSYNKHSFECLHTCAAFDSCDVVLVNLQHRILTAVAE